ncbi:hypothetical protein [Patiriisocius sp.]|uniref:hypothetical protein n=1 Tax=Patiriisocius sp. TaxID=2822396 RepID=UPI003F4AE604
MGRNNGTNYNGLKSSTVSNDNFCGRWKKAINGKFVGQDIQIGGDCKPFRQEFLNNYN